MKKPIAASASTTAPTARAGKPAPSMTARGRATLAKSAAKAKPQSKRASTATPQTKPAGTAKGSAGNGQEIAGQETAIRSMRTSKQIMESMAQETGHPQTVVRSVLENLGRQVRRHLRPRGSGSVTIPGLDLRLRRIAKPATKPRKGYNPATREAITIAAKPARIVVQARVLKRFREQIGAVTS